MRVIGRLQHNGVDYQPGDAISVEDMSLEVATQMPWAIQIEASDRAPVETDVEDQLPAPHEIPRNAEGLRLDGPTFELWTSRGYPAAGYPPEGYAELPSEGLTAYRAELARVAEEQARAAAEAAQTVTQDGPVDDEQATLARVEAAVDVDALAALEDEENARADGPRPTVLNAIDARFEALNQ